MVTHSHISTVRSKGSRGRRANDIAQRTNHEERRGETIPWSSWWAFWRLGGVGPRGMVCMYQRGGGWCDEGVKGELRFLE